MVALLWSVMALLMSPSHAFTITPSPLPSSRRSASQLASTAEATEYDIVKVDLADGRDYPIYIGAGYNQEEGKKRV
jgi:3-dehydroquinate synthase